MKIVANKQKYLILEKFADSYHFNDISQAIRNILYYASRSNKEIFPPPQKQEETELVEINRIVSHELKALKQKHSHLDYPTILDCILNELINSYDDIANNSEPEVNTQNFTESNLNELFGDI